MLNFYPGPSKVHPEVRDYLTMAYDEGMLSIPHRGERFVLMMRELVALLRLKLNIPQDYYIFFTSSATECWEIIAQSLTPNKSLHLYNGAFGEKWYEYAKRLKPDCYGQAFGLEEVLDVPNLPVEDDTDVICVTQTETSNGTQVGMNTLLKLQNQFKDPLLAIDATSSMAGLNLKFIRADIWFASVQKCFGLPAGMGVLVCSPRTIQRAKGINERKHYNSLVFMHEKMLNYQTTFTPNVLNLFLLKKVLEKRPLIKNVDQLLVQRAQDLYTFFEEFMEMDLLVENPEVRSPTVIAVKGADRWVQEAKRMAATQGITLGNGYGPWAKNTFRIANFPAISDSEYETLRNFISGQYH
ncbi:aminotransferase class V-fold PLP-dependent enzyme [Rufibacter latericius]|uniref:Alanine--glyoxylate aminotransferase family protein n=1 Tax=Rufibacter latericius TaxID=2487040 RepID=A0A3M9N1E8_9BACT|nr:aminotransferase class V-fold PLP-dependent enzyme [Rufibacter latericius]RNI31177.1 alanine--glyoxylate aminotransferase family protein [Rufibacter latericius]